MALLPHVVFVVNDHPYCRVREVQMRRLVFYAGRTVNLVWRLGVVLLLATAVSATDGIDTVLAFDWERAPPNRLGTAVQLALFVSAGVKSGRTPNVDHEAIGEQCYKMAIAVAAHSRAYPDKALVAEALTISVNVVSRNAKAGISRAVLSLLPVVRPAHPREVIDALTAIQSVELQQLDEVRSIVRGWIQASDDPDMLFKCSAVFGDWASGHIWDKLFANPNDKWSAQEMKLAYRLPLSDASRSILLGRAIDAILAAKDEDPIEAYAMPFQVLLRQSSFRLPSHPELAAKLTQALDHPMGGVRPRLLMWLSLSLDQQTAIRAVASIGASQARSWCSDAEWPKDDNESRIPRDRIHDLLLLAMCPAPTDGAGRGNLHRVISDRACSRYVGGTKFTKLYANRAGLWSLAWRTAPDPSAFVSAHSALTPTFSKESSPLAWILGSTHYGAGYLSGTAFPSRAEEPPADILKALSMPEMTPEKGIAIRIALTQYPMWGKAWIHADGLWKSDDDSRLFVVETLCSALRKGAARTVALAFAQRCVYPDIGTLPVGSDLQAMSVEALSYLPSSPDLVDRIASVDAGPGWPWDPVVDALLTLDRRHPRIQMARVALATDAHPATPSVLSVFDVLAGGQGQAFPADSWVTILEYPQLDKVLSRIERHAVAVSRSGAVLRDPRCLVGHMNAGLERPTERDAFDSSMRLLGILRILLASPIKTLCLAEYL